MNTESSQEGARRLSQPKINEGFAPAGLYKYNDNFCRIRLEKGKEKYIRPIYRNEKGWQIGEPQFDPNNGKPIYIRLSNDSENVFIVEGEKCVDYLHKLGLNACTSGGATSAGAADWEALRNKKVTIWPDNDEGGFKYADEVSERLSSIASSIEQVDVETLNLPHKGDCADWIDANPDATNEKIEALQTIKNRIKKNTPLNINHAGWEEPIPFEELKTPEISPDILPGVFGEFGKSLSEATETPGALATSIILGVVSAACGFAFRVSPSSDWKESINIYSLVALEPGNLKSKVFQECNEPLLEWESAQAEIMRPEIIELESHKKTLEETIKKARTRVASLKGEERGELLKEINLLEIELNDIPPLVEPEIFSNDITPENLGIRCSEQHGIYSILGDEGGFMHTISGLYTGGKANVDVILKGIDGGSVRVRRGDRSLNFNPILTISLAIQPEVIRKMGNEKNFTGIGFIERFLYFLPESKVGFRKLENPKIQESVRKGYSDAVKLLLKFRTNFNGLGNFEAPHHKDHPSILTLNREAKTEFQKFRHSVEEQLRPGGRLSQLKGWGSKLCGYTLRIAGLMHVMETCGDTLEISGITMGKAIKLANLMIPHALASFQLSSGSYKFQKTKHIYEWLKKNGISKFSQRDCHRALASYFDSKEDLKDCLEELEERGFIRISPCLEKSKGRPSITFEVNPKID